MNKCKHLLEETLCSLPTHEVVNDGATGFTGDDETSECFAPKSVTTHCAGKFDQV